MTLTTALAILAGLVLLGIVVQGAWAAHRAAPPRQLPAHDDARTVIPGGAGRHEPSLDGDHAMADTQPMEWK